MARIPEAELERLKQEVSLQRLVEAKGVELKRHGKDLIGLCPFHDDKSPSLVVSPDKNLWHCLGACQTGGSVIDWVIKTEGVSFRHAIELLRKDAPSLAAGLQKRCGRPAADGRLVAKKSRVPKLDSVLEREVGDIELLGQVVDFYHATLKESPEALGYLAKRGLSSAEMIDRFRLGYANRTLGYRLPEKSRKSGADLRGRLQRMGILRKSGHEHFAGSLVIPVLDEHGKVLEVYGRKVTRNLRTGTPDHLYLPGPHHGVLNIEALVASREIILCESLIDALTFWCAGLRNVTASYGTGGFTDEHRAAFDKYGIERVLIAYDRDQAGDAAAAKLAEELTSEGIEAWRIQFPRGMDANEYALSVTPAQQSLAVALRSAVWMGKGKAPKRSVTTPLPLEDSEPASEAEPAESSPPFAAEPSAAEPPPAVEPEPATEPATPEPATPEPASPLPSVPVDVHAEVQGDEVKLRFGDRRWRVRGLAKNMSYEQLRVNVLCAQADVFHVDTFDLYSARHRGAFLKQAASELNVEAKVLKKDLGRVLLKLEQLQDAQIQEALKPKDEAPAVGDAERAAALDLLRDPNLLDRILSDFERCGVVGEETNKLMGYLAAVSRKLDRPLAVIVQSSSAAGKSALMESILAFVPDEERVKYSAMTGQSLFYMGETNLKHKVLAIVEETGAERASYALKLLQSEGELTIASTGKDPTTGKLVTHEYRVEGPVMIFVTTTAIEIDDELLNRCMVLTVDEDREQTRAIHRMQRRAHTLEGLLERKERTRILELHRNAQRLLRPLSVANPYAEHLTFLDDRTRTRRDHEKYLTLMESIAVLHQYQRPRKTETRGGESVEYVEVTLDDIELANELAHQVLGRSLDELPPQTRRLLAALDTMATRTCAEQEIERSSFRFTRRMLREQTGHSYEQVRVHLERLVEMEYVLVHRGRRGLSFEYELLYDGQGQDGSRFLMQLLDVEALRQAKSTRTTRGLGGSEPGLGGSTPGFGVPLGAHTGPIPAPLLGGVFDRKPSETEQLPRSNVRSAENAHLDEKNRCHRTYPQVVTASVK